MTGVREADAERLDALRRRLYAPDATEADRAAYRAAVAAIAPPRPIGPGSAPVGARTAPAPPPRPGTQRVLLAGAAVALLAAGVVVLLVAHPLAAVVPAPASPAPTTSRAPADERMPASAAARAQFVRVLQAGSAPGLLDYVYGHPAFLPQALGTPTRSDSQEYSGQGPSTIALDPSGLAQHGGRVTVIVVLDRPGTYSYLAHRIAQRDDRSGPADAVASHAGAARAGEPVSTTFRYRDAAPTRLEVYLDETVKWGAVVVFTD